ncbi:DUF3857 domain-containing transglutaminase family protein [Sphingomonas sp. OK281]|uniref:DUF3857 domain-containing transglutaminase family protein n=1 Tax=Sphingomonas sp. OK281 TaxID=1881067 RepID=UPI0008ED5449|nr:DUF3857 domain-containing transglutaminase family protein [Sphingomonas sp. OK281]SFN85450.1 Transglutaminase-like superfamily protein [Sphingomonas sp. OK281]
MLFSSVAAVAAHSSDSSDGPIKQSPIKLAATKAGTLTPVVAVEARAEWVRDRAIPEATAARVEQAQNGIAYLLTDEQYRTRADGHDDWFRSSSKVTNRSGLESAGQIAVTYNPSFESIALNFVHLIRDGKVIDLTRETQFRVVERESDLDDGIVSGTLKAIGNLRDVRVGDIVDYATTVHTSTRLWPNHAFYHFSQRYSDPLAVRAIRLVWPTGMTPSYKAINSDIAFSTSKTAEGTEWEWIAQDPPAVRGEDAVPPTAFQWGRVDVSTMKEWSEVARWAIGLYQGDDSLPANFAARLDAIAAAWPKPGDRLTEAMRYVQDNVRYVGEELDEGSYVPRRPKIVIERGYGDCKDKSLLLAVALRHLGIDAVPALVTTRAGERLPDRLPSALEFDHVIVRAVIDGKPIWVDATGAHRGGRGVTITPSDLGYALPIRAGQVALERIDGFGERAGRMTVLERFTIDEAASVALTLRVETRFTGARADTTRASWAASSPRKLADGNLDFYRQRFPGLIESRPLELGDDRDGNVLTMVESYTLPHEAFVKANLGTKLVTRAYAVQGILPDRQANPRMQPLGLTDHIVNDQTIELHITDRVLEGLADIDTRAGPVTFFRHTSKVPDGLRIDYRITTGDRSEVTAAEAGPIYGLSDQLKDENGIEFHLDKAARSSATPVGIDVATWTAIKADMEKVVALTQKEDQPSRLEALSLLAVAFAKVAHPSPAAGLMDGIKGAILAELRRPQVALAALRSATGQYNGNPTVYRLWIGYELDLGTGETVAQAMRRTSKVQPEVIASLDPQYTRLALQKAQALPAEKREAVRGDICIALAEGGWQQAPRTSFGNAMLGCAITAHSLRGELTEARALLAKAPATDTLVTLAIDRRHRALWPDVDRFGQDGFRKSLELESARATTAVAAAPGNYETVMTRMQTLRALGRFEEALAAGKALASDKAKVEVAGSDGFWLVNEYAYDLRAIGRMDDAIAAIDSVLSLGTDRYPELVSLAINRAEMLIAAGRYQAGLDSLAEVEKHPEQISAYGMTWIWANQACAMHGLGRPDDAEAMEVKLATKPSDNWSAVTAAATCRNDSQAIADLLIARLRDDDARSAAIGLFIGFAVPEAHTPSETLRRDALTRARAMPAVQAEFAKYGRTIRYAGTIQGWNDY